jgi:hypothetical protein
MTRNPKRSPAGFLSTNRPVFVGSIFPGSARRYSGKIGAALAYGYFPRLNNSHLGAGVDYRRRVSKLERPIFSTGLYLSKIWAVQLGFAPGKLS